jgi:hypothetical protein
MNSLHLVSTLFVKDLSGADRADATAAASTVCIAAYHEPFPQNRTRRT